MALDKATLGTAIGNALATAHGQGQTSQDIALGNAIADAIDAYTKGATVDPAGTPTPLTAPAGGGPVSGEGFLS